MKKSSGSNADKSQRGQQDQAVVKDRVKCKYQFVHSSGPKTPPDVCSEENGGSDGLKDTDLRLEREIVRISGGVFGVASQIDKGELIARIAPLYGRKTDGKLSRVGGAYFKWHQIPIVIAGLCEVWTRGQKLHQETRLE